MGDLLHFLTNGASRARAPLIDLSRIAVQPANIKNEVETRVDNFLQITVFCPPEPRLDAFVYKNAGKVYTKN